MVSSLTGFVRSKGETHAGKLHAADAQQLQHIDAGEALAHTGRFRGAFQMRGERKSEGNSVQMVHK